MTDTAATVGTLGRAVLGVRVLLELGALVAVGYWGFHAGEATVVRYGLALGLPLLLAVVWAGLVAPTAPARLAGWPRLAAEALVFGGAALCLVATGYVAPAAAFAAVAVIDRALVAALSLEAY